MMLIITVSDPRRRATFFRPTIEAAATKVRELKASGAVTIDVRDETGQYLFVNEHGELAIQQREVDQPELRA